MAITLPTNNSSPVIYVSGIIYDDRGNPAPGLKLFLIPYINNSPQTLFTKYATTDSNGSYYLYVTGTVPFNFCTTGLVAGDPANFNVKKVLPTAGYAHSLTPNSHTFQHNYTVELQQYPTTNYVVTGIVKNAQYQTPVATAVVKAQKRSTTYPYAWTDVDSFTTKANGLYSVTLGVSSASEWFRVILEDNSYIQSYTPSTGYTFYNVTSNQASKDFAITPVTITATEYCLTSTVANGLGGEIRIPTGGSYCSTDGVSPESCAYDYVVGTDVAVTAVPDSGWTINKWELRDTNSLTSGNIIDSQTGGLTFHVTAPSFDSFLFAYFTKPNVNVSLSVNGIGGKVGLKEPTGYTPTPGASFNLTIPYGTGLAEAEAFPNQDYRVEKWRVNGTDILFGGEGQGLNTQQFSLDTSPATVSVFFVSDLDCDTSYRLTANTQGGGSIQPGTGDYCEGDTKYLTPVPNWNARLKEWVYDTGDTDITLMSNGILAVTMNGPKTVTAVFESLAGTGTVTTPVSPNVFYCPSSDYRSHLVEFDYTNNTVSSGASQFHFRVTFYSDASKLNVLYSTFSLVDPKKWYYDNGIIRPMTGAGVELFTGEMMRIVFDPEVLPQIYSENQKAEYFDTFRSTPELPLVCGARYFVDIEAFSATSSELEFVKSISLVVDCDDMGNLLWKDDSDATNWICSGQGQMDLKVSEGSDQSVYSNISSNLFGLFRIVWEGKRGTAHSIYGATWDASADVLYSSGQGLFDKTYIGSGVRPQTLADQAGNFYVSAITSEAIAYDICPNTVSVEEGEATEEETVFEEYCYPGQATALSSTGMVRLFEDDQEGSLVINSDKVIPVVSQLDIRLDVIGIQGAYAIQVRDSDDNSWGDWIIIDEESNNITRIDNSRFIVPWTMLRINGLRRVCCRVLTLYGVTGTFCTEIYINQAPIEYVFNFYLTDTRNEVDEAPKYNGMPILTGTEDGTTIYFSVLFSEPVSYSSLSFNVIQQGVDDIWDETLTKVSDTRWEGQFTIYKNDGVFNKDGTGFIQIIFPDDVEANACFSDKTDIYNLMVSDKDAERYQNLDPEEIFNETVTSKINKAKEIVLFKQYYDTDDPNFMFGSPDYFKND